MLFSGIFIFIQCLINQNHHLLCRGCEKLSFRNETKPEVKIVSVED